ncbi:GL18861 [Drosophila persimilis]|uniref:GL18861 n=1 Tax=Drosophila persimilis TaxID=7234 RepID=B4G8D0_DROPE|nr:GL18861 [Drosophila persimilis]
MRLLWLCAATLVVLANAGTLKDTPKLRFDNYGVYKLTIRNRIQLALIEKIGEISNKTPLPQNSKTTTRISWRWRGLCHRHRRPALRHCLPLWHHSRCPFVLPAPYEVFRMY